MAKLNNREIGVLAKSIFQKVQAKREQFKSTEEYTNIKELVKSEIKYDTLAPLINEYEENQKLINEMQGKQNLIISQIRSNCSGYSNVYSANGLDNKLDTEIDKKINHKFPTLADIENEVILSSLSGITDIVTAIETKFNLSE